MIKNGKEKSTVAIATTGIFLGTLDGTRTHDPPLRRRVLYPLSYEGLYGQQHAVTENF